LTLTYLSEAISRVTSSQRTGEYEEWEVGRKYAANAGRQDQC
jgi:hypothetical protein